MQHLEREAIKEKTICVCVCVFENNGKKVQTRGNVFFTCVEYTIIEYTTQSSIAAAAVAAVASDIYPTNGWNEKKIEKFCFVSS